MQIVSPDVAESMSASTYSFANDKSLQSYYEDLAAFRETVEPTEWRAALLVGTGGLLSLADVLPDNIYMTDINQKALGWIAFGVDRLLAEDDHERFIGHLGDLRGDALLDLATERKSLGAYHYLSSPERYEQARAALAKKRLTFVQMDFRIRDDIVALSQEITGNAEKVDTFNASNIHEHFYFFPMSVQDTEPWARARVRTYCRDLGILPWAAEFRIMASGRRKQQSTASLPLAASLDAYHALIR